MLESAIAQLQVWQKGFFDQPLSVQLLKPIDVNVEPNDESIVRAWGELHNLLEVADLILRSAHLRTESRGGHYRLDYPETDANWKIHTLVQNHTWTTSAIE